MRHPDAILFSRISWERVFQQPRYDVAHMTLQTLVNTYPNSKYAAEAKLPLVDPRIAECGEAWTTTPDLCDGGFAATPSTH
jgi:hypothetical protein